jgi:hypothetical protein
MAEPLIVLDGARVEIDGEEILVIRAPFPMDSAQLHNDALHRQIFGASFPLVVAKRRRDGSFQFFGPPKIVAKLAARNFADFAWTKVPVFPPPSNRR